jgi:hypothetical protein
MPVNTKSSHSIPRKRKGIEIGFGGWAWWHIPVITALRRLRQEDH